VQGVFANACRLTDVVRFARADVRETELVDAWRLNSCLIVSLNSKREAAMATNRVGARLQGSSGHKESFSCSVHCKDDNRATSRVA
jgi:hypothetical protein